MISPEQHQIQQMIAVLRMADAAIEQNQPAQNVLEILGTIRPSLEFNTQFWQMKAGVTPAPGAPPKPTPAPAKAKPTEEKADRPSKAKAAPGPEPILQVVKKNGIGPYRRGRKMGLESPIHVPRFKAAAQKLMKENRLTWEQMAQLLGGPKATKRTLQNLFFRKKEGIVWTSYGAAIEKVLGSSVMATKEEIAKCQQS